MRHTDSNGPVLIAFQHAVNTQHHDRNELIAVHDLTSTDLNFLNAKFIDRLTLWTRVLYYKKILPTLKQS
jgi:hypothetical protein